MRGLEYVPYPDLYGRPHVFVDGLRAPGTVLELSHWPGSQTPHRLKDDVSTQSVLRLLALADDERDALLGGASAVTCDHYDVDGLLSVLCLTRPEFALRHRSLLADVAVCGDFDVYTEDTAVQVCLALLAAERAVFTRIAPVSVDQAAAELFRGMLDVAEDCVLRPDAWRSAWEAEWNQITESAACLDAHPEVLTEHGDLAILADGSAPLHEYAVHARTTAGHVLRLRSDGRHSLRYRYESFVDLQSRRSGPRVRGDTLAERLNRDERNGTWFCEPAATATPLLQLYTSGEAPAPSSHSADRLRDRVTAYFQEASRDASLRWTPHAGWEHEAPGGPPSKEATA
jgi:hypothetical protein